MMASDPHVEHPLQMSGTILSALKSDRGLLAWCLEFVEARPDDACAEVETTAFFPAVLSPPHAVPLPATVDKNMRAARNRRVADLTTRSALKVCMTISSLKQHGFHADPDWLRHELN